MMIRDRDALVSRFGAFQDDVTPHLVHLRYCHRWAKQDACPRCREEPSCEGQGLAAGEAEANSLWLRPVEEECRGGLNHVPAQFVPCGSATTAPLPIVPHFPKTPRIRPSPKPRSRRYELFFDPFSRSF